MAQLKPQYGLTEFHHMGNSYGTLANTPVHHAYTERELLVTQAVLEWIHTRKIRSPWRSAVRRK